MRSLIFGCLLSLAGGGMIGDGKWYGYCISIAGFVYCVLEMGSKAERK